MTTLPFARPCRNCCPGPGYEVICFANSAALLSRRPADARSASCWTSTIPGRSGLDILKDLHAEDYPAPILLISDRRRHTHGRQRGSKRGARFHSEALSRQRNRRAAGTGHRGLCTPQVGRSPAKNIAVFPDASRCRRASARCWSNSPAAHRTRKPVSSSTNSTIEDHRANIMRKLKAKNAADLIRIVMTAAVDTWYERPLGIAAVNARQHAFTPRRREPS